MKRLVTASLTASVALLVISIVWSAPAVRTESGGVFAADGKAVFMGEKCNMCHDFAKAGITATTKSAAMKGPDIAAFQGESDLLAKYLKKEVDLNGAKHKKAFSGSDEELQALVDWILGQ